MYELVIFEGSGYNGANWVLGMKIPEHFSLPLHRTIGEGTVVLRSFENRTAALLELDRMKQDLIKSLFSIREGTIQ